jgi:hypothetical protein
MATNDINVLEEMRRTVGNFQTRGGVAVGDVGNQLLNLRDQLQFDDREWYREVTDHIVTLDSASTFTPTSNADEQKVCLAISAAVVAISGLVDAKAVQLSTSTEN